MQEYPWKPKLAVVHREFLDALMRAAPDGHCDCWQHAGNAGAMVNAMDSFLMTNQVGAPDKRTGQHFIVWLGRILGIVELSETPPVQYDYSGTIYGRNGDVVTVWTVWSDTANNTYSWQVKESPEDPWRTLPTLTGTDQTFTIRSSPVLETEIGIGWLVRCVGTNQYGTRFGLEHAVVRD